MSSFHLASDAKLAVMLVPPDSATAICGMAPDAMYGAVPPLTVNRAELEEQYALSTSDTNVSVGGDMARSALAVVLRPAEPGLTL